MIQTLGVNKIAAIAPGAVKPYRAATVRERVALICRQTNRLLTRAPLNAVARHRASHPLRDWLNRSIVEKIRRLGPGGRTGVMMPTEPGEGITLASPVRGPGMTSGMAALSPVCRSGRVCQQIVNNLRGLAANSHEESGSRTKGPHEREENIHGNTCA